MEQTPSKERVDIGFGGALDVPSAADQVLSFFKSIDEEKFVKDVTSYFKRNPLLTLGVGFGVGCLLGALFVPKR